MSFEDMLTRKYQILGETANSERDLRTAQAGLIQSQTATNPGEAAAREAQGFGAGAQGQGLGGYYSALGAAQPSLARSTIGLQGAQQRQSEAATGLETSPAPSLNGFAKGTDKVPGKAPKTGNTDTTPAMLTPGEAVLNVGAAEHLGRDTIDVLNAIGNIKMMSNGAGATQPPGPATTVDAHGVGGIPGYAQGTSGIDPIPGQGGTWEPAPSPPATGGSLRGQLGLGVPRPPVMPKPQAFADGTSDVPGYMDGTSEIMAATHADAARNSKSGEVGNDRKSGVTAGKPKGPDAGEESTKGYAKGTSKVPGKSAGKGPEKGASKITPEMLQAIMSLGKGGGGLIPPGQGAAMPPSMPMPQVAPGQGMR